MGRKIESRQGAGQKNYLLYQAGRDKAASGLPPLVVAAVVAAAAAGVGFMNQFRPKFTQKTF
jgi:hypothetical protein